MDITTTKAYKTWNPLPPRAEPTLQAKPTAEAEPPTEAEPIAEARAVDLTTQEISDNETEDPDPAEADELVAFLSAMFSKEQAELQADDAAVEQDALDAELHYDIATALWEGEYFSLNQPEAGQAFGNADEQLNQNEMLNARFNS